MQVYAATLAQLVGDDAKLAQSSRTVRLRKLRLRLRVAL